MKSTPTETTAASNGSGPVRYKTKEFKGKFWALLILEDVDRFIAFELVKARTLEEAKAQTFMFAGWLVNPDLFDFLDQRAFVPAKAKDSLDLMSVFVPLGQDEN